MQKLTSKDVYSLLDRIEKKVDSLSEKLYEELLEIRKLDVDQNSLLAEHSRRSTNLEKDNKLREEKLRAELLLLDRKINTIALPIRAINLIKVSLVWIGTLSLGILSILKLFKHL